MKVAFRFLVLVFVGASSAWPGAARAQTALRIAVLTPGGNLDATMLSALRDELRGAVSRLGYEQPAEADLEARLAIRGTMSSDADLAAFGRELDAVAVVATVAVQTGGDVVLLIKVVRSDGQFSDSASRTVKSESLVAEAGAALGAMIAPATGSAAVLPGPAVRPLPAGQVAGPGQPPVRESPAVAPSPPAPGPSPTPAGPESIGVRYLGVLGVGLGIQGFGYYVTFVGMLFYSLENWDDSDDDSDHNGNGFSGSEEDDIELVGAIYLGATALGGSAAAWAVGDHSRRWDVDWAPVLLGAMIGASAAYGAGVLWIEFGEGEDTTGILTMGVFPIVLPALGEMIAYLVARRPEEGRQRDTTFVPPTPTVVVAMDGSGVLPGLSLGSMEF